ncbi:hypothetical protein V7S43_001673 [Phytophthora oleae]|uniref:Uncharacterized protein n=1 Tax=Phytophthora oleae TaxID=2107226 RepID=A0ABD3G4W3_9STRA
MARHCKKMQDHVGNMESGIESLREENHELETTPWLVVSEYFRLFRLALTASSTVKDHSSAPSVYDVAVHRAFLQATMAPDLSIDSGYGPEALLDDYHRLSTYHPGLDVRLKNSSEGLMTATTQMKLSFTTSTLQNAFPHLINEPELWKTVGSKLVGQQFVVHGFIHFRWDVAAGRVVSLDYKADMLTPMLNLLGNIADVARVFEFASYKPDCGVRPSVVFSGSCSTKETGTLGRAGGEPAG